MLKLNLKDLKIGRILLKPPYLFPLAPHSTKKTFK
jgi:hypothetical protein